MFLIGEGEREVRSLRPGWVLIVQRLVLLSDQPLGLGRKGYLGMMPTIDGYWSCLLPILIETPAGSLLSCSAYINLSWGFFLELVMPSQGYLLGYYGHLLYSDPLDCLLIFSACDEDQVACISSLLR